MITPDDLRQILATGDTGHVAAPPARRLAEWFVDWQAAWAADYETETWLIEPVLAYGRGHALYAPGGTGKSLLALEWAAALATGRGWGRLPPGPPIHVLYVDLEMTLADLIQRLEEMGYGPDTDLSHLHYALLPDLAPLNTEPGGDQIVATAVETGSILVIIDTIGRAVEGEENDNDTWRDLYRHLGMRLKDHNIAYLRLDHEGKDSDKGQRGASAKRDDVDVVWHYTRTDGGGVLKAVKRRMGWIPERVELVIDPEPLRHRLAEGMRQWVAGTKEIAGVLERLGADASTTKRAAREMLRNAGEKVGDRVLCDALRWLKMAPHQAPHHVFSAAPHQEPAQPSTNGKHADQSPAPDSAPLRTTFHGAPPPRCASIEAHQWGTRPKNEQAYDDEDGLGGLFG